MTENIQEFWVSLARKILACVMIDPGAVFPVLEIIKSNATWFPPKERGVWRAIMQCVDEMIPPTIEAVGARVNGDLSPAYVKAVAAQFSEHDNSLLVYNTEQLRDIGILVNIRQLGNKLSRVENTNGLEETINLASTELSGLWANRSERSPGAIAIDQSAWDQVKAFSGNGILTGLKWFDNLTGGLWPGMNYWVAAAYKSGKTTLMRNIVLNAALMGNPVGVYCAEGNREMFALDCQAMLATAILLNSHTNRDHCRLSGLFLLRHWQRNRDKFRKDEIEAINEARRQWIELPIRIYDTQDDIRNPVTLHYLIKRDRIDYGVRVVWADYSQLFGGVKGTLFERQSTVALKVQEIADRENIAFGMLTQKNEEGIRAKGDGYSPQIKGGGDAAAAADFLIVPEIDHDQPNIMQINLKLSRRTNTGSFSHVINPSSGLILDKWCLVGNTVLD